MNLICYLCRKVICKMKKVSPFEEVFDFCDECQRNTLAQFEEQFRKKRLTTTLRIER